MSLGREFYERHIRLLEAQDVDGLIARQYDDDAALTTFDFTIRGREALRAYFIQYLKQLGSMKLKSTDKFSETDNSVFFEATIETAHGVAHVYDVFVLKDGKAIRQFAGLISFVPFKADGGTVTDATHSRGNSRDGGRMVPQAGRARARSGTAASFWSARG